MTNPEIENTILNLEKRIEKRFVEERHSARNEFTKKLEIQEASLRSEVKEKMSRQMFFWAVGLLIIFMGACGSAMAYQIGKIDNIAEKVTSLSISLGRLEEKVDIINKK